MSIALAATPAAADPPLDVASNNESLATYREAVARGTAAFVARRFGEAREAFEQAFAINPDPVLVFNIASCWRRDGDIDEALVAYRRFLSLAPSDDARRMLAEETIAALEEERAPPPPVQVAEPPPPQPRRSVWRPIGLTTAGVGAGSLIYGVIELVRASSLATASSIDTQTTNDTSRFDGQRDGGRDGQRDGERDGDGQRDSGGDRDGQSDGSNASASMRMRGIVFGAAGAAAMAAGVTMYVIGRRSERAVRISVSAGSSGGQLVVGGRF